MDRPVSNLMNNSIDLKRVKDPMFTCLVYSCLYKLVLIAHAQMPLINAHHNVSKVRYSTGYFDSENPDEKQHRRHFIRVCSVFYTEKVA